MPVVGFASFANLKAELGRLTGDRVDLLGTGGPVERAINDAYAQIILKYKHAEFEVRPPYMVDTLYSAGSGTNVASGYTVTLAAAVPVALQPYLIGAAFSYDDDSTGQIITATNPAFTQLTVTPEILGARTIQPCKIFINRYPLPWTWYNPADQTATGPGGYYPFFIYDATDIALRMPLKQVDVRVFDRSAVVVGNPIYYARVENEIYVFPWPYRGVNLHHTLQIRYARRPKILINGTDTLDPLPLEWHKIVLQEALAILLEELNETERASAIRDSATRMAVEIMKPYIEETEDAEPALTPRMRYW